MIIGSVVLISFFLTLSDLVEYNLSILLSSASYIYIFHCSYINTLVLIFSFAFSYQVHCLLLFVFYPIAFIGRLVPNNVLPGIIAQEVSDMLLEHVFGLKTSIIDRTYN